MPDDEPRCCGNCLHYGKKSYGRWRFCLFKCKLPSIKGLPACVKLERRMMRPTDGENCPAFQPKESTDAR